MNDKEFNLKCAEFMGLEVMVLMGIGVVHLESTKDCIPDAYNPYHDANDRNKVLEKMRMETFINVVDDYLCRPLGNDKIVGIDKSMEAAQNAAIEAYFNK